MTENSTKKEITINKDKWKSNFKIILYPFISVFLLLIIIIHFGYVGDCCSEMRVYVSIPEVINFGEYDSYKGYKEIYATGDVNYDNYENGMSKRKYFLGNLDLRNGKEIKFNYFTRLINYYLPYIIIEKWKLLILSTLMIVISIKARKYLLNNYAIKIK